jgi:hypothetical protein
MCDELLQEINFSKLLLREICQKFGNNEWEEETPLPEILNEYLYPYLQKTALKGKRVKDFVPIGKLLFSVWRIVFNKPKANLQDRYLKLICDRLADGYTEGELVQAIIGLSKSDHHVNGGYTHIQYCVRSSAQTDLMIHKATQFGITAERCQQRYELFVNDPNEFFKTKVETYTNPKTGSKLK